MGGGSVRDDKERGAGRWAVGPAKYRWANPPCRAILRLAAGGASLQNRDLQSGSGRYLFGHHQAAPPAADDHYFRGF